MQAFKNRENSCMDRRKKDEKEEKEEGAGGEEGGEEGDGGRVEELFIYFSVVNS